MTSHKTVGEWIAHTDRFAKIEFSDVIEKYGHLEIVEEFSSVYMRDDYPSFPQSGWNYRYIHNWVLLSDGSAIGWNESGRTGWSFPRIGKKTVDKNFKRALDA